MNIFLLFWYIQVKKPNICAVLVSIRLYTKHQTADIGWALGPNCVSRENLRVTSNSFYEKDCTLAIDQTYTVNCKSSNGDGWNSNFLVIENQAYCENFTMGHEEVMDITIRGN